ncbi:transporter associated domain-containing protein [Sphingobacterium zhuxiongii]|uniref:transporter associated domain-containing protein n=1 Tax=Sphingobacterium zhuxiongii TaxID=2662364 RepID=UPI001E5D74CD|nr:transporter associated domain-containing protein [Sphingobacterium sp. dk4302]
MRQREDGSYVIDGSYQLDDFIELFKINLTEDDEDEIGNLTTVAGLVFLLLDHIPEEGEQVVYKNLEFEVLDMDGHRIDKLIVNVQNESSDETANID